MKLQINLGIGTVLKKAVPKFRPYMLPTQLNPTQYQHIKIWPTWPLNHSERLNLVTTARCSVRCTDSLPTFLQTENTYKTNSNIRIQQFSCYRIPSITCTVNTANSDNFHSFTLHVSPHHIKLTTKMK